MTFGKKEARNTLGAVLMTLAAVSFPAANAQAGEAEVVQTLTDRMAINDLLVDYYGQIGTDNHDFSAFFVPEAKLDVNGWLVNGYDEIQALYDAAAGGAGTTMGDTTREPPIPRGRFDMMFSNLKITVDGNTAVATMYWYSMAAERLVFPPAVTEYGRERTQFIKRDGAWRIIDRRVISDGGMPDGQLGRYQPW